MSTNPRQPVPSIDMMNLMLNGDHGADVRNPALDKKPADFQPDPSLIDVGRKNKTIVRVN